MLDLLLASLLTPTGPEPADEIPTVQAPPESPVEWRSGTLDASLARAAAADTTVLVYFWSSDSGHCASMWSGTLDTPRGHRALRGHVCHSAPIGAADTPELIARYAVSVLPTVLVLDGGGELQDGLLGVMPPAEFDVQLARIAAGTDTLGDLRARVAADERNLDLRYTLALKLEYLCQQAEADAVFETIRRDDPRGTSLIGARLQLLDVQRTIEAAAPDPTDSSTFDPEPLRDLLPRLRHDPVRFEAWSWLSGIEEARGERERHLEALGAAWEFANEAQQLEFGPQLAFAFWDQAEQLTSVQRRLARTAARRAAELAEEKLAETDEAEAPEWPAGEEPDAEAEFAAEAKLSLAPVFAALACAEDLMGEHEAAQAALARAIELAPGNLEFRALKDRLGAR